MFMKKLIATVMSVGIISTCCMSAFAGTIYGTGRTSGDPNGRLGSIEIDYSITTKLDRINTVPVAISKMQFEYSFGKLPECHVTSISYIPGPNPDETFGISSSSDVVKYTGQNNIFVCSCSHENVAADSTIKTVSTFDFRSPYIGSFYTSLTKPGWDW